MPQSDEFPPEWVEAVARAIRNNHDTVLEGRWKSCFDVCGGDMKCVERGLPSCDLRNELANLLAHDALRTLRRLLDEGGWQVVPRALNDDIRAAVWRAQYEHANARLEKPETDEVVELCTQKRVHCDAPREQDHAAYAAQLAAAASPWGGSDE